MSYKLYISTHGGLSDDVFIVPKNVNIKTKTYPSYINSTDDIERANIGINNMYEKLFNWDYGDLFIDVNLSLNTYEYRDRDKFILLFDENDNIENYIYNYTDPKKRFKIFDDYNKNRDFFIDLFYNFLFTENEEDNCEFNNNLTDKDELGEFFIETKLSSLIYKILNHADLKNKIKNLEVIISSCLSTSKEYCDYIKYNLFDFNKNNEKLTTKNIFTIDNIDFIDKILNKCLVTNDLDNLKNKLISNDNIILYTNFYGNFFKINRKTNEKLYNYIYNNIYSNNLKNYNDLLVPVIYKKSENSIISTDDFFSDYFNDNLLINFYLGNIIEKIDHDYYDEFLIFMLYDTKKKEFYTGDFPYTNVYLKFDTTNVTDDKHRSFRLKSKENIDQKNNLKGNKDFLNKIIQRLNYLFPDKNNDIKKFDKKVESIIKSNLFMFPISFLCDLFESKNKEYILSNNSEIFKEIFPNKSNFGKKKPKRKVKHSKGVWKNYKLIKISKSNRSGKKMMAVFEHIKTGRRKTTHFGAAGMSDYTKHKDPERMKRYNNRHKKRENWNDPTTAGALSKWILWNKPSLKASISDYKRRFF